MDKIEGVGSRVGWSTRIGLAIGATIVAVIAGGVVASIAIGIWQHVSEGWDRPGEIWKIGEMAREIVGNGIWILGAAVLFYSLPTFVYLLAFEFAARRHRGLRDGWKGFGAVVVGSGVVLLAVQVVAGGGDWNARTAVAVLGTVVGIWTGLVLMNRVYK